MHGTMVKADNLWTDAEDEVLREHWPDRKRVGELLPHRTQKGIERRAHRIRIATTTRESDLTVREEKKIRQLCECFSSIEVIAAIVGRKRKTVARFMERRGWTVKKPAPVVTGDHLYDEVRRRAFEMNLNFHDLDRSLGYRARCFSKAKMHEKASIGMIKNAVEALGGRLVIEWESLEGDDND